VESPIQPDLAYFPSQKHYIAARAMRFSEILISNALTVMYLFTYVTLVSQWQAQWNITQLEHMSLQKCILIRFCKLIVVVVVEVRQNFVNLM